MAHPAPLLQCWGWGEVQSRFGWSVERVALKEGLASVQLRGSGPLAWAYVPRGPVPPKALPALIDWARDRRLARLRVEPETGPEFARFLADANFQPAPETQPRRTSIVALADPEQTLASFKPKTRYNIRLALKRGVTVDEGRDAAELERQTRSTADRQAIALPGRSYYEALLELLPFCRTYVARHQGEPLAAIVVAHHGARAYYLFGGASGSKRELMPAYAAQWAAMQAAASRGCRDYDLWGVPPSAEPSHPWHGLWQFKTGFGGPMVDFVGSWEISLRQPAASLLRAQEAIATGVRRVRARL